MANHCKGGCGKALPSTNKSGFAWGHTNGCPAALPPPSTQDATQLATLEDELTIDAVDGAEETLPTITLELPESSLDRIYAMLPIEEKGLAIITALTAFRE